MKKVFITRDLKELPTDSHELIHKVTCGLMTPDMAAAIQAGCTLDISLKAVGNKIVFKAQTKEKVSILKAPDGTPVSVIVKR